MGRYIVLSLPFQLVFPGKEVINSILKCNYIFFNSYFPKWNFITFWDIVGQRDIKTNVKCA
jgi:hypothetical protein